MSEGLKEHNDLQYAFGVGYRNETNIVIESTHQSYNAAKKRYDFLSESYPDERYMIVTISESIPIGKIKYLTTIRTSDGDHIMQITRLFNSQADSTEWVRRMDASWNITRAVTEDEYNKWVA